MWHILNTSDSHKYQQEQINLNGGDVKLFRRGTYGNWQIKIWIRENNNYYTKSLRTKGKSIRAIKKEVGISAGRTQRFVHHYLFKVVI